MERIWIYQINRPLDAAEEQAIRQDLDAFMEEWNAHGQLLQAAYDIPYGRFIILKVDQNYAEASGCSIDSSVRFLRELEKKYHISLFDRQQMAYLKGNAVKSCTLAEISSLYQQGEITDSTPVFNSMLSNSTELESLFEQPFAESGYSRFK